MRPVTRFLLLCLAVVAIALGCATDQPATQTATPPALPPEPTVTYANSPADRVEHGEVITAIDSARQALHAQHHGHTALETRSIPGTFEKPAMTSVKDFALAKKDLVVINPGPGEYVHVMEGQRHGYQNLTIGITYTAPGGAPPMHTHKGEESHVLLEGQKVLYALGDSIFVMEGPYIVNIPPMVPHSFQNLDDQVAELVVIFPTNVWEYDVLNHFPFQSDRAKTLADEARK
ncbi:MAG: cupin domain-containing protein [candidate division Zixibacteria bacterium]|nr:cupin domain-containing protein [candidate division Zixibacteria bacterium]